MVCFCYISSTLTTVGAVGGGGGDDVGDDGNASYRNKHKDGRQMLYYVFWMPHILYVCIYWNGRYNDDNDIAYRCECSTSEQTCARRVHIFIAVWIVYFVNLLYFIIISVFTFNVSVSIFLSLSVGRSVGRSLRWMVVSIASFSLCICVQMCELKNRFFFLFESPIERWRIRKCIGASDTFGAHCAKTWRTYSIRRFLSLSLHLLEANGSSFLFPLLSTSCGILITIFPRHIVLPFDVSTYGVCTNTNYPCTYNVHNSTENENIFPLIRFFSIRFDFLLLVHHTVNRKLEGVESIWLKLRSPINFY